MAGEAICSIDGCNNPVLVKSRGWCSKHYQRWQHTGDPQLSRVDREQTGKPCIVEGCEKKSGHHGMCAAHHRRMKVHGSVADEALHPRYKRREKWLRAHVGHDGEDCLIWPFAVGDKGRGMATLGGVQMSAPKAMCILAHGSPPSDEHETAHSCGKGHLGCIHPGHLSWKTHAENEADKVEHGTVVRGEKVNTAKLTEADVRAIRSSSEDKHRLAAAYGVAPCTIYEVRSGRSWAWLSE